MIAAASPFPLAQFSDLFGGLFLNALAWWQWLILALVPPAIVALYFLKLRRQPLEVPSTYLWHRTIEDLHVNSLWQRLRQSLLLFLQLLLVAVVMLACLRPGWRGAELTGDRFIFLVDTSASMSATDVAGAANRLELAKTRVGEMIDGMKSGDVAMIISFSNVARVEQPFTDNRRLLRTKLAHIRPTQRTSDVGEALRAAAGLANPGSSGERDRPGERAVAEALPATVVILSDGGFGPVPNFSLGNLHPVYVPIGSGAAGNVGIVAFTAERNPEKPDRLQAFGRLENFLAEEISVDVSLYLDDTLVDAANVTLPPLDAQTGQPGTGGADFDLADVETGVLKMEVKINDEFPLDNVAYAALSLPRRGDVLLVSPGNEALELAMQTPSARKLIDLVVETTDFLATKPYQDKAAAGGYDLIIYDQCAPQIMPAANTLFVGRLPPIPEWSAAPKQAAPAIFDTDRAHPIMQFVELGNVRIAEATPLKPPRGSTILIDSDLGPLLAIAPRDGYEDAVMGFELFGAQEKDGRTQTYVNTDWPIRLSFPLYVGNVLAYMSGARGELAAASVQPGKAFVHRSESPHESVRVVSPTGRSATLRREQQSVFTYTETDELGVYEVFEGPARDATRRFTVNLFDSQESDIAPRANIYPGNTIVAGQSGWESARIELWKYLLLGALGVLLLEWYIYNRRVYL
jgi:hypothetical protein